MTTDTLKQFEDEYLAKILGFCYQKVNNRADAEELSSDITIEVLKATIRERRLINSGHLYGVYQTTHFANGYG